MKLYRGEACADNPQGKARFSLSGEFRAPKKGEWYLSGAIPQAWRAPNDLTMKFHILRKVG